MIDHTVRFTLTPSSNMSRSNQTREVLIEALQDQLTRRASMPQSSDTPDRDDEFISLIQPRTQTFTPRVIPVAGIEAGVCEDIARRQQMGIKKYGVQLAENPAGEIERLQHAYEEALDLANYLKWLIVTKSKATP